MGVFKNLSKWLLIIFSALLLISAIAGFFLARHYKPILANALRKEIQTSSKGLYKLEFSELDIKPLLGRVYLENVRLIPDTTVYRQQQAAGYAPQTIYDIKTDFIRLRGISLLNYFSNKTLEVDFIIINQPDIKIIKDQTIPEAKKNSFKKDLYDIISPIFKKMLINSIRVVDGKVFYELIDINKKHSNLRANSFSLLIDGVRIDKQSEADFSRLFYSDNIRFIVNDYHLHMPDSLNIIKFKQLQLSTKDSSISISHLILQPRYSKYQYAKAAGKQTDWIDLKIDSISIQGIQFRTLLFREHLEIKHADVLGLNFHAYRDKRVALGDEKVKIMFHEKLKNALLPINITSVTVHKSRVEYEEFSPKGKTPGTIFFSSLKAQFSNVTNNQLAKDKNIVVDISSDFMGVGELKTTFTFPVSKADQTFTIKGSLGRLDLHVVNQAVESLALVKLKDGRVNLLDFNINANNVRSTVRMKFLYNDLDITIFDPKTGEKKGLASTLVNALILDSDNPSQGEAPRIVNASFVRNQQKQIFNFFWKTVFQGIKASVGVDQQEENRLQEMSEKFADRKKKVLEKREDRKQNRQEKRRERKLRKEQTGRNKMWNKTEEA